MRIGVAGCAGRMGRSVILAAQETEGVTLAGGCERRDHPVLGVDLGSLAGLPDLGVPVTDDAGALFAACDVVIDFTAPESTTFHARLAATHQTALVCGTTGLRPQERDALAAAAATVPIVYAANMSVGVTLLVGLTAKLASLLPDDYDIEIVEMHHRMKADAPSGTALALGAAAAEGRNVDLDLVAVRSRDGHTGPRSRGSIGFATLRGGDVVGEHTVIFAGAGERIELAHKASSRAVFAHGAIRAARWARSQPPGFYGMADVLGIK